jgi:hypothetical protein
MVFIISLQILWFLANPLLVHVMGSKKIGNQGRNGCQSNLVVAPTPILVHRSGQLSCKEFVAVKFDIIPHDVISCPC